MFPVTSEVLRTRIRNECLLPLELDNQRVYEMTADGSYVRRRPAEGQPPIDAQLLTWGIVAKAVANGTNGSVVPASVLGASLPAE